MGGIHIYLQKYVDILFYILYLVIKNIIFLIKYNLYYEYYQFYLKLIFFYHLTDSILYNFINIINII